MKVAVLGTNDYHAVMQQLTKDALLRQAGYIAPKLKGAEFESLIRFISGLDDSNLALMRGGGMADFVAYLNDEGTTCSYDDYDDYDDGYRHS